MRRSTTANLVVRLMLVVILLSNMLTPSLLAAQAAPRTAMVNALSHSLDSIHTVTASTAGDQSGGSSMGVAASTAGEPSDGRVRKKTLWYRPAQWF